MIENEKTKNQNGKHTFTMFWFIENISSRDRRHRHHWWFNFRPILMRWYQDFVVVENQKSNFFCFSFEKKWLKKNSLVNSLRSLWLSRNFCKMLNDYFLSYGNLSFIFLFVINHYHYKYHHITTTVISPYNLFCHNDDEASPSQFQLKSISSILILSCLVIFVWFFFLFKFNIEASKQAIKNIEIRKSKILGSIDNHWQIPNIPLYEFYCYFILRFLFGLFDDNCYIFITYKCNNYEWRLWM